MAQVYEQAAPVFEAYEVTFSKQSLKSDKYTVLQGFFHNSTHEYIQLLESLTYLQTAVRTCPQGSPVKSRSRL